MQERGPPDSRQWWEFQDCPIWSTSQRARTEGATSQSSSGLWRDAGRKTSFSLARGTQHVTTYKCVLVTTSRINSLQQAPHSSERRPSFLLEQLPGRNIPSAALRHTGLARHMSQALLGWLLTPIVKCYCGSFLPYFSQGNYLQAAWISRPPMKCSLKHQNPFFLSLFLALKFHDLNGSCEGLAFPFLSQIILWLKPETNFHSARRLKTDY